MRIQDLPLSVYTQGVLERADIFHLGTLVSRNAKSLLQVRDLGPVKVSEIEHTLSDFSRAHGVAVTLGMDVGNWFRPPRPHAPQVPAYLRRDLDHRVGNLSDVRPELASILRQAGIEYLEQLVPWDSWDIYNLLRRNGISNQVHEELARSLERMQMPLGSNVGDWQPPEE